MIPIDVLLVFIAASAALSIAPGPDNIFVLTQSALHGKRAGLLVTLGLCTGLIAHISAVALGVAAIFQTSVVAFTVLKLIGASYLLYLAWKSFGAKGSQIEGAQGECESGMKLYLRGIVMNVTNPKVALFFLAFLPQFADPQRGSVPLQIAQLGLIFMLIAWIIFSLIAIAASRLGAWLRRSEKAQIMINRVAGGIFVLLAGRLLLSK